jgi:hypothetical protein
MRAAVLKRGVAHMMRLRQHSSVHSLQHGRLRTVRVFAGKASRQAARAPTGAGGGLPGWLSVSQSGHARQDAGLLLSAAAALGGLETPIMGLQPPAATATSTRRSRSPATRLEPLLAFPHATSTTILNPYPPAAVSKLEWQSPLQVVKYPDPRLRAVNAKIGTFDDSLVALAKEMLEIMYQWVAARPAAAAPLASAGLGAGLGCGCGCGWALQGWWCRSQLHASGHCALGAGLGAACQPAAASRHCSAPHPTPPEAPHPHKSTDSPRLTGNAAPPRPSQG